MKNFIALLTMVFIFLSSCTKENLNEHLENQSFADSNIKLVSLSDGKSAGVTMLEFVSIDHYEKTIETLQDLIEQHEDSFCETWSNLDDDALNDKEEEIGFVDYQPLIDFENAYKIPSSMRQSFEQAENDWLGKAELDDKADPSLTYSFDMVEMALLNANGEVKIGDFILKLTNKGFVKIDNVDVATLIRINEGDVTAYEEPTVTHNIEFGEGDKGTCTNWKQKNYTDEYVVGSRKVVKHVHFHSYPWKGTSCAKITSYKKRRGKWKKYRMNLGVANQSYFRDNNCSGSVAKWSGWKRKKRKSIEKNNSSWGAFPQYRAEKNVSVIGYYEYSGNSNQNFLTWEN